MGKGDKKSKRGKIFMGSHGVSRFKKNKKNKNLHPQKSVIKEKKVTDVDSENEVKKTTKKVSAKKNKNESEISIE